MPVLLIILMRNYGSTYFLWETSFCSISRARCMAPTGNNDNPQSVIVWNLYSCPFTDKNWEELMPGSEECRGACWRWPWSRTRTWWGSAGQSHCTGNGQTVLTSGTSVPETDKRYSKAVSLYWKRTNGTHKRSHCTGNGKRKSQEVSLYRKLTNGTHQQSHSFQKTKNGTQKEPCRAVF